jgi:hypothetical protein
LASLIVKEMQEKAKILTAYQFDKTVLKNGQNSV